MFNNLQMIANACRVIQRSHFFHLWFPKFKPKPSVYHSLLPPTPFSFFPLFLFTHLSSKSRVDTNIMSSHDDYAARPRRDPGLTYPDQEDYRQRRPRNDPSPLPGGDAPRHKRDMDPRDFEPSKHSRDNSHERRAGRDDPPPAIANQTQKRDVGVRTMTTTITNTAHAPNETKMRPPPMVDPKDTASRFPNQTRLPQIETVETLNHA